MIECVKEYLSNIASELGKNIEDMDMESIERAAHIIMESEKAGRTDPCHGNRKAGACGRLYRIPAVFHRNECL